MSDAAFIASLHPTNLPAVPYVSDEDVWYFVDSIESARIRVEEQTIIIFI